MRRKLVINAVAIVLVTCCAGHCPALTQDARAREPMTVDGSNYESTLSYLETLARAARENQDALIFVIGRLGGGESSRRLNRRRLFAVRDFLKEERLIPAQRVIAAEGEPVRGVGRVEVYIGGKLFMVFTLPRNKFFAGEG